MQFLAPLYLLGALAIAAPIIIHLSRGRKVVVVQWAAHRFLLAATQQIQKRLRLEDLILLLLRCLIILLLALLFARPFFVELINTPITEESNLVLLVDVSASMGYADWNQTRLDHARAVVDDLLNSLPKSTGVFLLLYGERVYPAIDSPTSNHELVREELEWQQPRPESSNLESGLEAAINLLSSGSGGSIVVVTDGQAEAWKDQGALVELSRRAQEASINLKLRTIEDRSPLQNLGVVEFSPLMRRPITGQPFQLRALVRNGGERRSAPAKLFLEAGTGESVEETTIPALDPGELYDVIFETSFARNGVHLLTARLPGDSFVDDDKRSLGLHVSESLRVGIVEGAYSKKTPISPAVFIRAAVVPTAEGKNNNFPIEAEMLEPQDLSDADRLGSYHIVIMTEIDELSSAQSDSLRRYLKQGGALWMNPPSDPESIARFTANPTFSEFVGGSRISLSDETSVVVAAPPYHHSISGFWNRTSSGALDGFSIRKYLHVEPGNGVEPVLELSNGDLLFTTNYYNKGRVFFSAIPMDREWSDLPLSAQFVPLVQRILIWLAGKTTSPAELTSGETWRAAVAMEHLESEFHVIAPNSENTPQVGGEVKLAEESAQVVFTDTAELGPYYLFVGEKLVPIGAFGVNLPADETDLRRISEDAAAILRAEAGRLATIERRDAGWLASIIRSLPEPWVMLAVILIITALAESCLAHHFSRPR